MVGRDRGLRLPEVDLFALLPWGVVDMVRVEVFVTVGDRFEKGGQFHGSFPIVVSLVANIIDGPVVCSFRSWESGVCRNLSWSY